MRKLTMNDLKKMSNDELLKRFDDVKIGLTICFEPKARKNLYISYNIYNLEMAKRGLK